MNSVLEKSKFKQHDFEGVKDRIREEKYENRISQRNIKVNKRRFCSTKDKPNLLEKFSHENIKTIALQFQKFSVSTQDELQLLRQAFTSSDKYIDTFMAVDNALYALVGYLTSRNSKLQLEASWILTNMTAVDRKHYMKVARACGPYFITYLRSASLLLQEQSALALGNLASNGIKVCELMIQQGVLFPLVTIVKNGDRNVLSSAVYALTNIAKFGNHANRKMIEYGLHDILAILLSDHTITDSIIAEVGNFMLHLIDQDNVHVFNRPQFFSQISFWVQKFVSSQYQRYCLVIPLIRCIGNIANEECINSTPDMMHQLLQSINMLIRKPSQESYVVRETLWILSNIISHKQIISSESMESLCGIVDKSIQSISSSPSLAEQVFVFLNNCLSFPDLIRHITSSQFMLKTISIGLTLLTNVDILLVGLNFIESICEFYRESIEKCFFEEITFSLEHFYQHENEAVRDKANYVRSKFLDVMK